MEIQGEIIKCLPRRQGVSTRTGNTWEAQEYVLQTKEQYPKNVLFQVFGHDKINEFNIKEGETLKISFDINAKEWHGKWFNTITAYKVERANDNEQQAPADSQQPAQNQQATPPPPPPQQPQSPQPAASGDGSSDDLPF